MVSAVMWRKLIREVMQRKGSLLALVGIMTVGIGVFVGMAGMYRDLERSRDRYYRDYRLADFTVDLKRAPLWVVDEARKLPNVRAAEGRIKIAVRIDLPNLDEPISGTAISMPGDRRPVLNGLLLRTGAWFSGENDREVILNESFARENRLEPGSRIKVLLLDKEHDLLVVGTAMSPEFVYLIPPGAGLAPDPARFGVMYLTEDFMRRSCDLEGAINQIVGLAHDPTRTALDNTLRFAEKRFDAFGVAHLTPIHEQPSARFLADELQGLKVTATVLPALFLVVAALVLNILMGRIVAQQRVVIGTLKAVGLSSAAITRHYVGFGVIVGLLGGIGGLALGFWLQSEMAAIYLAFYALPSIPTHFYPSILITGLVISVIFATAGTLRGARRAARLEPAEAMRPPPPEKGGRVLPERIPFLWRLLPFKWKMMLRAVFRNPFRSTVSVLASVIATALILSTLSLMDALDYLMRFEFVRVAHQDVTISLRDPKGERSLPEFSSLHSVSEGEPQLSVLCDLSHGPFRRRITVTGLPPSGRLFTPLDSEGRPVTAPEEGLILSRKLAEILNAQRGDKLRLRPLIARRQEAEAIVAGTVDTYLGLAAYADLKYLSRLLGESWSANVMLGMTDPGPSEAPFLDNLKERPAVVGLGRRIRSLEQLDATFGETMGTMIFITVLFAGLVAFGSVLNAALVSLDERQREASTLRVLGYTPGQITRIFSGESLLLNGAGILAGLAAGAGLTHLLSMAYDTELYRFPVIIYPSTLGQSAATMAVFVGAAQLILYWMIRKLVWLEVMKVRE